MADRSLESFAVDFAQDGDLDTVWKRDRRFRKGYRVLYDRDSGGEVPGARKEIQRLMVRLYGPNYGPWPEQ